MALSSGVIVIPGALVAVAFFCGVPTGVAEGGCSGRPGTCMPLKNGKGPPVMGMQELVAVEITHVNVGSLTLLHQGCGRLLSSLRIADQPAHDIESLLGEETSVLVVCKRPDFAQHLWSSNAFDSVRSALVLVSTVSLHF